MRSREASRHPSEILGPVFIGALSIAYSPLLYHSFFAVRAALLLIALGPSLVLLGVQATRDTLARLAVAFLALSTLATVVSVQPVASVFGEPNWGTGLLFTTSAVGLWAWGRTFTPAAMERCRWALLAGVGVNVAVAVLQAAGAVPAILTVVDRPFGLTGNAVHFGALCAAVVVLVPSGTSLHPLAGATVVVLAAGVQLSGGRSALGLLLLAVVAVGFRTRRITTTLLVMGLAATGVVAASFAPGAAPSATERAAAGTASGSVQPRLEAWKSAGAAFVERPLLGHGPGRFRAATSPHRTATAAALEGDSRFADAHNLFIELAVTTGLTGVVAFGAWVVVSTRSARGPWAHVALLLLLAHLVEPLSVAITPFMAIAFGLASSAPPARATMTRRHNLLAVATGGVGAAAAAVLLVGEARLQQGSVDFDRSALAAAERLLPPTWPTASLVTTRVEGFYGAQDPTARRAAVAAARRAVRTDPTDDRSWARLGDLEAVWGSKRAAAAAYGQALRNNPWSIAGLRGRAQTADELGDQELAAHLCRRLKQVTTAGSCAGRALKRW